jgi:phosphoenolpyruvate synthase/pyruvate phosphate dikinase
MLEVYLADASEAAHPTSQSLGAEGFDLLRVSQQGLQTVPTLVVGTAAFKRYRESHSLADQVVSAVLKFAIAMEVNVVAIRPSTTRQLIGLQGPLSAEADFGRIKYAIERIYRSWYDERATAYRITHTVSELECSPAVIVQVLGSFEMHMLATRNPRDGQLT